MVSEKLKQAIEEFRKAADELYRTGIHPFRFGKTLRIVGISGNINEETLNAIRRFRLAKSRLIRAILEEPV
jgi:hypothetical protein